ncbi:337_t:CDS:2 [Funneliformis geosporum]|nr:337_t:CDS:2 [Funneliformis geosporum]
MSKTETKIPIYPSNNGNEIAQCNLGNCYFNGWGIEKNLKIALYWYQKSANNNNEVAQCNLGNCYYNGWEIKKNFEKAFFWYQKSAENNNEIAQYNLADNNNEDAQYELGNCYQNGFGVEKDLKKAFKWYQKSAKNDNKLAQLNLGNSKNGNKLAQYNLILFYQNEFKVEENNIKIYKKLAKQNNSDIQYYLGFCYENGIGIKKDLKKAFDYYKKATGNGNKFAQFNVGMFYQNGWGVKEDLDKAFEFFEKSAKQDYIDAQSYLGFLYKNGIGTQRSLKKAFHWYQRAAENGDEIAQYNLGNFYRYGLGIESNKDKALEWYKKLSGEDNKFFIGNDELLAEDQITNNTINYNPFNYHISESKVRNNVGSNTIPELITLKATITPGISSISNIEVEKLEKLLISRKGDIDCILKSQPIYSIGIDFHQSSTKPCISCWVIKSLDNPVLECIENMFDDQYEIIYQVLPVYESSNDDDNGSNSNNSGKIYNGNDGNNTDKSNKSNDSGNSSGNDDEDGIFVSSTMKAFIMDSETFQEFVINVNFWVEITHEKTIESLRFNTNVNGCGIGTPLSDNCLKLKHQGFGYFLHAIKVQSSSIPENTFRLVDKSQPEQLNQKVEVSKGREIGASFALNNITGSMKNVDNARFSSNEWKLKKDHNCKGECWSYQYTENNLKKDNSQRGGYAPGVHSGQWHMLKDMRGFCITITQELHFQFKIFKWFRTLPNAKTMLSPCPKMAHSLEITFSDLKDFNSKLANIKKTFYENDGINITVGKNNSESEYNVEFIQRLKGNIKRSKTILY